MSANFILTLSDGLLLMVVTGQIKIAFLHYFCLLAKLVFSDQKFCGPAFQGLCPVVAGALHYLFLTVFCWMLVEGLHIYVSLTKVFEIDKSSRLLCYYIFAYGAPALVVAISAAIRYDGYGTLVRFTEI